MFLSHAEEENPPIRSPGFHDGRSILGAALRRPRVQGTTEIGR
jgi:hypothetical protein